MGSQVSKQPFPSWASGRAVREKEPFSSIFEVLASVYQVGQGVEQSRQEGE